MTQTCMTNTFMLYCTFHSFLATHALTLPTSVRYTDIPVYFDRTNERVHPMVAFLEVVKQAIAKAYHVFVGSFDFVPIGPLEELARDVAQPHSELDATLHSPALSLMCRCTTHSKLM
jgi:hypothetical protein